MDNEINIGQVIHGNPTIDRVILNIGGEAMSSAELTNEQLAAACKHYETAIDRTKAAPTLAGLLMLVLFGLVAAQIPAQVAAKPPPEALGAGWATLLMIGMTALFLWSMWRIQFGDWKRRKDRTVAELERKLAVIEAELAYRSAASPLSLWQRVKLWAMHGPHR